MRADFRVGGWDRSFWAPKAHNSNDKAYLSFREEKRLRGGKERSERIQESSGATRLPFWKKRENVSTTPIYVVMCFRRSCWHSSTLLQVQLRRNPNFFMEEDGDDSLEQSSRCSCASLRPTVCLPDPSACSVRPVYLTFESFCQPAQRERGSVHSI